MADNLTNYEKELPKKLKASVTLITEAMEDPVSRDKILTVYMTMETICVQADLRPEVYSPEWQDYIEGAENLQGLVESRNTYFAKLPNAVGNAPQKKAQGAKASAVLEVVYKLLIQRINNTTLRTDLALACKTGWPRLFGALLIRKGLGVTLEELLTELSGLRQGENQTASEYFAQLQGLSFAFEDMARVSLLGIRGCRYRGQRANYMSLSSSWKEGLNSTYTKVFWELVCQRQAQEYAQWEELENLADQLDESAPMFQRRLQKTQQQNSDTYRRRVTPQSRKVAAMVETHGMQVDPLEGNEGKQLLTKLMDRLERLEKGRGPRRRSVRLPVCGKCRQQGKQRCSHCRVCGGHWDRSSGCSRCRRQLRATNPLSSRSSVKDKDNTSV